ncbi:hypothetical protein [Bradyrhizobium sp. BR 10289]|uniref:hypothetical protein n=1 Tax=Bradyrhizobium sp. BR 10289 TaxID=2749993 RepID=UPI001C64CB3D|nr:hypothetical protein [Bradyrhizobium sp. BR 10289]MBW7968810.1 hypothetical protein [Bradyrhizobium sp. BR 10289]
MLFVERHFMKKTMLFAGLTLALAALTTTSAAGGAVYISRTGSDSASCVPTQPCASMGKALSVAGVGGEIICMDKSPYGAGFTIQQSVTISCADGLWEAPTGFIFINLPAGAIVSIEGLTLDGTGASGTAIFFSGQGSLQLHRARIGNNPGSSSSGLLFAPNGPAKLQVSDSVFYANGTGTGGGVVINPQSGGTAQVALERVSVIGNAFGVAADGSRSTGGVNMTIADSMIAGNSQDGIVATTSNGGAPIGVYVKNTKSVTNAIGIRSIGPNVTVRVDGSSVIGNGTGLSFSGGGLLATYGNNAVSANGSNGAFSGSIPLQ